MNIQEIQETQEETEGWNLRKPTPPTDNDPEKQMINNKLVDRIWSVIVRRKLYNTFTQDLLESLIDRACVSDYRVIQKKFKIDTIDMTVDLAVMPLQHYLLSHR